MAATWYGHIESLIGDKLGPRAAAHVKPPQIVKLVVFVVFATKDEEWAILHDTWVTSSWLGNTCKGISRLNFLPRESLYIEGVHVIHSCSVLKAAENDDLVTI